MYDSSSGVHSTCACKINLSHGIADIHVYFLPISVSPHMMFIKSQSCMLNKPLSVLTKKMKVVKNKPRCLLYSQSLHGLQSTFSVTLSKIYGCNKVNKS